MEQRTCSIENRSFSSFLTRSNLQVKIYNGAKSNLLIVFLFPKKREHEWSSRSYNSVEINNISNRLISSVFDRKNKKWIKKVKKEFSIYPLALVFHWMTKREDAKTDEAFFSLAEFTCECTRSSSSVSKVLLGVPSTCGTVVARTSWFEEYWFSICILPIASHASHFKVANRHETRSRPFHLVPPRGYHGWKKGQNDNAPVKTKSRLPRVKCYDRGEWRTRCHPLG